MLILDLDDTIFKTSSMNPRIFDSSIDVIVQYYNNRKEYSADQIISELWGKPIDVVFSKYGTPEKSLISSTKR